MVAPKKINYEETRLLRLEENKKRMAELKLTVLAQSLRTTSTPKPSPVCTFLFLSYLLRLRDVARLVGLLGFCVFCVWFIMADEEGE